MKEDINYLYIRRSELDDAIDKLKLERAKVQCRIAAHERCESERDHKKHFIDKYHEWKKRKGGIR